MAQRLGGVAADAYQRVFAQETMQNPAWFIRG